MAEAESAHGKLSKVDQEWNANRFLVLLVVVLGVAFAIIYSIASLKSGDWSWYPFAHQIDPHVIESSQM